jgi:diguanylate cyclase (GGDEF)-like protein/PAS domain S-box-containing protein
MPPPEPNADTAQAPAQAGRGEGERPAPPPHGYRTLSIVWPFLAIALLQAVVAVISVDTLSALRAYVEGESLWSKSAKDSVARLKQYAVDRDEVSYRAFRDAVKVIELYRQGRAELQKASPDLQALSTPLVAAGTHQGDVPGIKRLYQRFKDFEFLRASIAMWSRGDELVTLLEAQAEEIRQRAGSDPSIDDAARRLARIQEIDEQYVQLNRAFSATLGDASREASIVLLLANVALALTLLPLGMFLSRRMVERSHAFQDALRLSEERYQLAVVGSHDGLWDWNLITHSLYLSPQCRELLGIGQHQAAVGWTSLRRIGRQQRQMVATALRRHLRLGEPLDMEFPAQVDGQQHWFRLRGESVRDAHGRPIRVAGSLGDISARKRAEAQLHAEMERAQVTLQSIADAVITTDVAGAVRYFNPVAQSLTGLGLEDAVGQPFREVFPLLQESSRERAPDPVGPVVSGQGLPQRLQQLVLLGRDGREIAVDGSAAPIRDGEGRMIGTVLVFHDMTRERQFAASLSYQATHDELTGLINRREFERRLEGALQSARESERHHSVMFLDLDQFKVVNDTCGHAAGDELMRRVAAALRRYLREGDTLGRLGGDEFGVLLMNCPPGPAERIAELLRQAVAEHPFSWQDRSFRISVSIGVVHVTDESLTLAELMSAADTACYMAKDRGRNRVQVFSKSDSELSQRQGEMEWVERIHRASEQNRFRLFGQEIFPVHMPRRVASHVELLVRMVDEEGRLIPPGAFLPAAERYNVMSVVEQWVIEEAFRVIEQLNRRPEGNPLRLYSINLSGVSIGDERFLGWIQALFERHAVPFHNVCFEITETAAVLNLTRAVRFIEQLRGLGCHFSLDDFGTGMSSFSYLKHLPVDYVKIDGGFIKDMLGDPIDRAMVEAINNIGHVMGKRTIAEFVEDKDTLMALREIGVDYAQGFGLARPRPFDADWGLPVIRGVDTLVERGQRAAGTPRKTRE